jgi:hypothetical protein
VRAVRLSVLIAYLLQMLIRGLAVALQHPCWPCATKFW